MKTFVIDSSDFVQVYASGKAARQCRNGTPFATEKDFASVSADWPMPRLVAIWNQLPEAKAVQKFTNRATAVRRIWAALQDLAPAGRTKAELVLSMITRPSGATLKELMEATGWQAHSVRGLLSTRPKKLGIHVESFKRGGERVYRIR